jgi:spore coat polysaccharide biosynthesis predicted glycosyltransferase SpsG
MQELAVVSVVVIGGHFVSNLLDGFGIDFNVVLSAAHVVSIATEFYPDVVVFDLLDIDEPTFGALTHEALSVSLSPVFTHLENVDVLFHRTRVIDPAWARFGERPQIRSGLKYAVLGEECQRIPTSVFREAMTRERLSVAVSMGGTDAANKTLRVLEALRENGSRLLLWVLLGEGYEHSYHDLVDCAQAARHEVILAKTNDSMWHILRTCAVAVLAGGTTTYQAVYAGLPSINLLERDEQYFLLGELVEEGAVLCVGTGFETALQQLNGMIQLLGDDRARLAAMHECSDGLIDGRGASRIAQEIAGLVGS